MDFEKLLELVKENTEAVSFIQQHSAEFQKLTDANKRMASDLEYKESEAKKAFETRDSLKNQVRELEEKITNNPNSNEEFAKQIETLKKEYESKLTENDTKYQGLQTKHLELLKDSKFSELNLGAKLPKWEDETRVKGALDYMKFQLSQGLEYDQEVGDFVYKENGVSRVNAETGKPYTIAEMANTKLTSGEWTHLTSVDNPNSGGGRQETNNTNIVNSNNVEVEKGNANKLMAQAFNK